MIFGEYANLQSDFRSANFTLSNRRRNNFEYNFPYSGSNTQKEVMATLKIIKQCQRSFHLFQLFT